MTKKEEFPIQVKKFLRMCEGIGISVDDLIIDIEEKDYTYEKYTYITMKVREALGKNGEITFDYISEVDYEKLKQDIKECENTISLSKDKILALVEEHNIEELKKYGYGYCGNRDAIEYIVEEYCFEHSCNPTTVNRKKAIIQYVANDYEDNKCELENLREIENEIKDDYTCVFSGSVSIENIDFVYSPESIKGGIILNGGIVIFEMAIDERGIPASIQFNVYDNFVDWEWELDFNDFVINYNEISDTMNRLKEKNIEPNVSEVVNYEEMLHENDLVNLYESPIGALYKLKDVITQTYLQNNSKKQ